jgi:hypothetical protein
MISCGAFPTVDKRFLLHLDLLKLYRALNLRSGLALNAFVDVVKKMNSSVEDNSIYNAFRDSFQAYRALMFQIESVDDMLDQGCPACPRPDEAGEHYWALDGNVRLFRYKRSAKVNFSARFSGAFAQMTEQLKQKVTNNFLAMINNLTRKCYS